MRQLPEARKKRTEKQPRQPDEKKPAPSVKRPRDISELPLEVKPWPLKDRVAAAKTCIGSYDAKLVALAITMVEHPETIRNGNCFDILCKGQYEPWGTHRADWGRMIPAGYVMLDEETPMLAFHDPKVSLQVLIAIIERRRIFRPDEVAVFMLNLQPGTNAWGEALIAFERELNVVIQAYQ